MKRIYESVVQQHFEHYDQMLFLAGPRQVGKTTISYAAKTITPHFTYLNWDNQDHRSIIIKGPASVANYIGLQNLKKEKSTVTFDELHKYKKWKIFLKGFFDTYKENVNVIVTGSSRLDVYRRGGDSLMGRYFPYRIHPMSVAECFRTQANHKEIHLPEQQKKEIFETLFDFGGFPEPFLKKDTRFYRRWRDLRKEQLFRGDIRDSSRIQEIAHLELLAELLKQQAGQLVNYTNLANKIRVSVDTVRRWLVTLSSFYYCFAIRPWKKNVPRSLMKEPKIYLWDWSEVDDPGARAENMVACHLLKAVHFWTDQGLGHYDLYFLRDKNKREVDFIVTKDNAPWFLVEVKFSDSSNMNPNLEFFQERIQAKHAFQVVFDMDYEDANCFSHHRPIIVPAKTFLAQLV